MALLETSRLILRQRDESDTDGILKFYTHPSIAKWININLPSSPLPENHTEALLNHTDTALLGCVIQEKSSSLFVGLAGLIPWRPATDPKNRNVEVFIGLLPEFWGKGYAFEAMICIIEHAFWEMDMHKVSLAVVEGNGKAIQLYKRLGFVEEGRDRQVLWMNGGWKDILRMGILENEWDEWKARNPGLVKTASNSSKVAQTT